MPVAAKREDTWLSDGGPLDGQRWISAKGTATGTAWLDRRTRPKQLLVQFMQTSRRAGQIDPGCVELEKRGDEVFSGTGH